MKNNYIDSLYKKAISDFNDYVDILYIQASNKTTSKLQKEIDEKVLEEYLRKRGYTMNYVLGKRVMIKDFTCVYLFDGAVEIWHDKANSTTSVIVNSSILTSLPIALDYMERIS